MRARKWLSAMLGIFALGVLAKGALAADTFTIDPVHSSVGFSVKHMVVSNVKGQFNDFAGTITYDEKDIAKWSVQVTIKAASIDTRDDKRNTHLKSPDFLDVEKYPEITFKSTKIEKSGDGYVATGNLTMHGVTKEIKIPFTLAGVITDPMGNVRLGVSALTSLNRQDYGVSWSKKLDNGGLIAGDEVAIDLEVEAVKPK